MVRRGGPDKALRIQEISPTFEVGPGDGVRTRDLPSSIRALYPLSYAGEEPLTGPRKLSVTLATRPIASKVLDTFMLSCTTYLSTRLQRVPHLV